ncbi:hypothetical protein ACLOJK_037492 [Asimina triloba]
MSQLALDLPPTARNPSAVRKPGSSRGCPFTVTGNGPNSPCCILQKMKVKMAKVVKNTTPNAPNCRPTSSAQVRNERVVDHIGHAQVRNERVVDHIVHGRAQKFEPARELRQRSGRALLELLHVHYTSALRARQNPASSKPSERNRLLAHAWGADGTDRVD